MEAQRGRQICPDISIQELNGALDRAFQTFLKRIAGASKRTK
jgi:hypothetical protein